MFFLLILKLEKSPPSTEKMVDVTRENCTGNESPMNLLFDTVMHEVIPITTFLIFCNIVDGGELIWVKLVNYS